jgi:hypothetical protein
MSNGHLCSVAIGYDGTALSVSLTDPSVGAAFNAITSLPIDIATILGTNNAYVGFTSATGAGWENHDIVNWQFANTTELAPPPRWPSAGTQFAGTGRRRPRWRGLREAAQGELTDALGFRSKPRPRAGLH